MTDPKNENAPVDGGGVGTHGNDLESVDGEYKSTEVAKSMTCPVCSKEWPACGHDLPDSSDGFDDDTLSRKCPCCGNQAEYPDCAACGYDFSAPRPKLEPITLSRGWGKYDNTPKQYQCPDFWTFRDACFQDRGSAKGQQWVLAACAIAPDDERAHV